MKKIIICMLLIFALLCGCAAQNTESGSPPETGGSGKSSFSSGVWLSYSEINGMLKSSSGFKAEFAEVIKNCSYLKISDIYVHVRAFCDSLFKSEYFPQISAAKELDYDVFEYIISECRKTGIRVHAWLNPYRVSSSSEDTEALDPESPAYKWLHDNDAANDVNVVKSGGIYLNPAEYQVRELVIDGIREILEKYDVDGIHFDDYFYPTTDESFDSASYEKYKSGSENPLPLDEWRRSNVNALISGCYTAVKFYSKDILFTVSPAASVENNYNELYADVEGWLESGCVDCIIPQLYFGFEYPDTEFSFEQLLEQWCGLASCNDNVSLLIGLAPYKTGTDSEPDREEWNKYTDIIARQVEKCYENENVSGFVLFSYSSLVSDNELNTKQRENLKEYIDSAGE